MGFANAAGVILQQGGSGTGIALLIVYLAILVITIAGMWKTFTKADQPGWAAIIPFYNIYIMLKIGDNEWWWLLVIVFVPIVQLYGMYKMYKGVAEAFGEGLGFVLGLWFLPFIFFPLLGFGDYSYRGSSSVGAPA